MALTFHGIERKSQKSHLLLDAAGRHYVVTVEFFSEMLGVVPRQATCTVADFFRKKRGDWTIITFDDGLISDFEVAYPLVREKGLAATFFVTVSNIGTMGYVSHHQLREMADAGMEIGSHGLTHSYLVEMGCEKSRREIVDSKDRLEQLIGRPVFSFAPVGGHFHGHMLQDAREAGYLCFATMIPGVTKIKKTGFVLRRNHLQAGHDVSYMRRLLGRESCLLFKNGLRYRILFIVKMLLGMQRYDRWKSRLLEGDA